MKSRHEASSFSPLQCLWRSLGFPVIAFFLGTGAGYSQSTFTWDGDTDGAWSTATNWVGDSAVPATGDDLIFAGTTNTTTSNDLAAGIGIAGIRFTNTGDGQNFSLAGNAIDLTGNVVTSANASNNSSGQLDTISLDLRLTGGDRNFAVNALDGNDRHDLSVSGAISEDGSARRLSTTGGGYLFLSGTNTYTGGTLIGNGTNAGGAVQISNSEALGTGPISINGNDLRLNNVTIDEAISIDANSGGGGITGLGTSNFITGGVTLNSALDVRGSNITWAGGVTSSGDQGISINGSDHIFTTQAIDLDANNDGIGGTFTVTSAGNNKANATQLNVGGNDWGLARINFGGYLLLGGSDFMPTDEGVEFGWDLINQSEATLDLNGKNQTVAFVAQTSNSFDEGGNITITSTGGTGTLTISQDSGSRTYQGRLTGTGANALHLVKNGDGTQIIENLTASDHNYQSTTINGGTLKFLADGNLTALIGNRIELIPDNITINNGATLAFEDSASDNRMAHQGNTTAFGASGGGTLDYVAGNFLFQGTSAAGTDDQIVTSGGSRNLITSSGGSAFFNPQGSNTIVFDVALGTDPDGIDLEMGVNFGNGRLEKRGAGTMTLTNAANAVNPNTGPGIVIVAGTLEVGGSGRLNSGSYAHDITNDGVFRHSSNQAQALGGDVSGAGSLEKIDGAQLTLSGNNTYSGTTTIGDGSTVNSVLVAGSATGLSDNSAFVVESDGTLKLNGFDNTIGSLTGSGTVRNEAANAVTLTVGGLDTDTAFSGILQDGAGGGALSLAKEGTGTLILSGTNTYTGITTVTAGTLLINGDNSASTNTVTVEAGARLGGTGVIGGDTIISGIHDPGNSPGIQSFTGNLTYGPGGETPTVIWELIDNTTSGPGVNFDRIRVDGDLDFAAATTLELDFNTTTGSSVNWADSFWGLHNIREWQIWSVGGTLSNFGNLSLNVVDWADGQGDTLSSQAPDPANFYLFADGNNVYLRYEALPEPTTFGLIGLVLSLVTIFARSRRRLD